MRFEPRLFRDDDEPQGRASDEPLANGDAALETVAEAIDSADLELPADLAALGEQLSDDADHLALSYLAARNAEATPSMAGASTHRGGRLLRWGGAAAGVLIALGTWQFVTS